ncbi:unnamed protein product, partial [Musa textilis]
AVAPPRYCSSATVANGSTAWLGRWYRPYVLVSRLTQAVAPPLTSGGTAFDTARTGNSNLISNLEPKFESTLDL